VLSRGYAVGQRLMLCLGSKCTQRFPKLPYDVFRRIFVEVSDERCDERGVQRRAKVCLARSAFSSLVYTPSTISPAIGFADHAQRT
jgi:histone H3/H4